MKELLKGIASFPHILTEADVLRHSYGIVSDESETPTVEVVAEPEAKEPEAKEPEVKEPEVTVDDAQLTDAQLAAKLEAENTKASLIEMAEAAGVDQSGNKSELSARLVAHYRVR